MATKKTNGGEGAKKAKAVGAGKENEGEGKVNPSELDLSKLTELINGVLVMAPAFGALLKTFLDLLKKKTEESVTEMKALKAKGGEEAAVGHFCPEHVLSDLEDAINGNLEAVANLMCVYHCLSEELAP
jgi:hypothetical protein